MNKIISVYELLGLIKDGKAPKKIKFDDTEYKYGNGYYYRIDNEMPEIFTNEYNIFLCLNDKVEILEEDKPIIESISIIGKDIHKLENLGIYNIIEDIETKLNEVIEFLNRKEDK